MHFIVARGCDDTYIYANDPNKEETPRKQASSKFQSCMKQAFIFWPAVKTQNSTSEEIISEPVEPAVQEIEIDLDNLLNIIDISKHQGTIDFNKLAPEVSMIIARVSCGSDKDIKIDQYAAEMNRLKIPFGVYCYSYAGTIEKAKDEAQKMVTYSNGIEPLFYVLDAEEKSLTNEIIKAFATELRKQTNKPIGCYVAHNHYKDYNYSSLQSLFDFTWIPRYGKNTGTIEGATKPAYFCDLWQFTSKGKIAGINGYVDMNVITGDGHNLQWFINKG